MTNGKDRKPSVIFMQSIHSTILLLLALSVSPFIIQPPITLANSHGPISLAESARTSDGHHIEFESKGTEEVIEQTVGTAGTIDLTEWNYARDGIVDLNGEWVFYWQELLDPQEIRARDRLDGMLVPVPAAWSSYVLDHTDGTDDAGLQRLSNHGYATYHLQVRLPQSAIGQRFSLLIPNAATAYRLWIDDVEAGGNGVIGKSLEEMVPVNYSRSFDFNLQSSELTITIQVANFVLRKGGLWDPIQLGTMEQIDQKLQRETVYEAGLAGVFLIFGLYHLYLYLLRPESKVALYFSVFCMSHGLRVLVTGQNLLAQLLPATSWEWCVKFEYIGFLAPGVFYLYYTYSFYPQETNKRIVRFAGWFMAATGLFVLFTPARVYTELLLPMLVVMIAFLIYVGFIIFRAARRRRQDTGLYAAAWILIFITAWNDSLHFQFFLSTDEWLSIGILAVVILQAIVLARRYSRTFLEVRRLSSKLSELNESLETKIKERTAKLAEANEKLREAWLKVTRVEQSRRRLMSNISHELGTPLSVVQGYVKGMLDGVVPADANTLQLIYGRMKLLDRMIDDLGELSKLEARQVSMDMKPIRIGEFVEQAASGMRGELEQAGLNFIISSPAYNPDRDIIVLADAIRLEQVLTNYISNAKKHTSPEGYVQVEWRVTKSEEKQKQITVLVRDSGTGIPHEALAHVFDRYYQAAPRQGTRQGMGLGLAICKEIIEIHGGTIGVSSEPGKGSTFYFSLPVYQAAEEKRAEGGEAGDDRS